MKVGRVTVYPWHQELGLLGFPVIILILAFHWQSLPDAMPLHYFFRGVEPFFASPPAFLLFALLFHGIAWFVDAHLRYAWLCGEGRKRFNWLQLIFPPALLWVPPTATFVAVYSVTVPSCENLSCLKGCFWLSNPLAFAAAVILCAEVYLIITELCRKKHPIDGELGRINITEQQTAAAQLLGMPDFCVYERVHSPKHSAVMVLAPTAVLGLVLVFAPPSMPVGLRVIAMLLIVGTIVCLAGGATYVLTKNRLTIRIGLFQIPVANIRLDRIESVKALDKPHTLGGLPFFKGKLQRRFFFSFGPVIVVETARASYLMSSPNAASMAALILKAREKAIADTRSKV